MSKKIKTQANRKVNLMLSNGLYIISAKNREGTPLYTLYMTDFVESTRIIFDAEAKRVLPNKAGIELKEKDIAEVAKTIGWEVRKAEEAKVVMEAGKKIEEAKEALKSAAVSSEKILNGYVIDHCNPVRRC